MLHPKRRKSHAQPRSACLGSQRRHRGADLIITLEGKLFDLKNKKPADPKPQAPAAPAAKAAPAPAAKPAAPAAKADNGGIPGEVIAAISAAVATVMGSGAVIHGIRRVSKPAASSRRGSWGDAGVREHTTPFM